MIADFVSRGDIARDAGRYDEAAALYGEALAIDPLDADLRLQCAQMLAETGETNGAEGQILEAARLAPENANPPLSLGRLYKQTGRIKEAAAAFERASKLNPDWAAPAEELAHISVADLVTRGDVARDANRYRDAATFYSEALGIEPFHIDLRLQCAHMLAEAGETSGAERHYQEVSRSAPEHPDPPLRLGRLYKQAGRIKDAAAAFERASELRPDWAEPAEELAHLRKQGWRGHTTEDEPAVDPVGVSAQVAPTEESSRLYDAISQLQRAAANDRLIPEIIARKPSELLVSRDETIELLRFGLNERSHWGTLPTFRGVEAIRGLCLSSIPFSELQISLNGVLMHRGPLRGGYNLQHERKESLLKYVFNVWLDFSGFLYGRYELELRFRLPDGQSRVRLEHVVIAEPLLEQSYPESDGVIALPASDTRTVDDQINSRSSIVRSVVRTTLPQNIRNVLILRTDQLGDLVTSIPALRKLRELFPHSNLVGLLTSSNADLAATLKLFDECIVVDFPEDPLQSRRTMTHQAQEQLREKLAPYGFELALDLAVSGMSRILLLLSGAAFLYGFDPYGEWTWLTAAYNGTTHDIKNRREVVPHSARILAFVERLGTMLASRAEAVRRADLSRETLAEKFGLRTDKRFIVLHTGARIAFSRWSNYSELAAMLIERTDFTVVLIASDAVTKEHLPRLSATSERLIVIEQQIPFDDLDTLIHFCTAFVGNDSGPKHLASLRGVPVVSIHSARVNWNEWGQEITGSIISRKVPCAGCTIYFDENECGHDFDCVSKIGVKEVFEAVMEQV